jgi:hypothetical protein
MNHVNYSAKKDVPGPLVGPKELDLMGGEHPTEVFMVAHNPNALRIYRYREVTYTDSTLISDCVYLLFEALIDPNQPGGPIGEVSFKTRPVECEEGVFSTCVSAFRPSVHDEFSPRYYYATLQGAFARAQAIGEGLGGPLLAAVQELPRRYAGWLREAAASPVGEWPQPLHSWDTRPPSEMSWQMAKFRLSNRLDQDAADAQYQLRERVAAASRRLHLAELVALVKAWHDGELTLSLLKHALATHPMATILPAFAGSPEALLLILAAFFTPPCTPLTSVFQCLAPSVPRFRRSMPLQLIPSRRAQVPLPRAAGA